ncbi:MAG: hypothetical protein ACRCZ2_08075 [Fusobacteriaceae bacterium]
MWVFLIKLEGEIKMNVKNKQIVHLRLLPTEIDALKKAAADTGTSVAALINYRIRTRKHELDLEKTKVLTILMDTENNEFLKNAKNRSNVIRELFRDELSKI